MKHVTILSGGHMTAKLNIFSSFIEHSLNALSVEKKILPRSRITPLFKKKYESN